MTPNRPRKPPSQPKPIGHTLMPDFTQLLKRPLNDVKRPDTLPQGTYHGMVLNYEIGESKEKKTPYVRFNCRITGPGDDIPAEMLQGPSGPIDVTKKRM